MSAEEFARFRELVVSDDALADRLQDAPAAGFRERVAALAKERGFDVSVEDVTAAELAGRRAWLERGLDP